MSHEIRTPMNGILGFSELLSDPDINEYQRNYYIKIINSSGRQLLRIIDDILEISSLGTKQIKAQISEISVCDIMLQQFSIFDIKAKENKTPLYLRNEISENECKIFSDESKIIKIVSNLLENALKYTNTGFIEFGCKFTENSDKKLLDIYIKDTGIGIDKNKLDKIFDRFTRENKEFAESVGGLGLGLSIAKENAELIGGKIIVESEKGKGSNFTLQIPYKPADKTDFLTKKIINENITDQKIFNILIAEDEEINFLFLEIMLKRAVKNKFNLFTAKNGIEAVDICKNNDKIDLIFMDIKMPEMNGFEAAKIIKLIKPETVIIAQTAYSSANDRDKALNGGFSDFISKPIKPESIKNTVNKYLYGII